MEIHCPIQREKFDQSKGDRLLELCFSGDYSNEKTVLKINFIGEHSPDSQHSLWLNIVFIISVCFILYKEPPEKRTNGNKKPFSPKSSAILSNCFQFQLR